MSEEEMQNAKKLLIGLGVIGLIAILIAATVTYTDYNVAPRGTGAGSTGRVRFYELSANGTSSVDLKAPDSLAATTAYALPNAFPSTSGYCLTSDTSGVLSWAACGSGSGSLILLEQHTASNSASLDFTSCISATYDDYVVKLVNVLPVYGAYPHLAMRVSTDGGSTYDSGSHYYDSSFYSSNPGGSGVINLDPGIYFIPFNSADSTSSYHGVVGEIEIFSPGLSPRLNVTFHASGINGVAGAYYDEYGGGTWAGTGTVNAFQILFTTGNVSSGSVRCYGVAK